MAAIYLDNNATTAVEPRVAEVVTRYLFDEYGNAGSRTHAWGANASRAVEEARRQVASVANARADEVIFTSGATEANNLALLGLAPHRRSSEHNHVIVSAVEHKAVL